MLGRSQCQSYTLLKRDKYCTFPLSRNQRDSSDIRPITCPLHRLRCMSCIRTLPPCSSRVIKGLCAAYRISSVPVFHTYSAFIWLYAPLYMRFWTAHSSNLLHSANHIICPFGRGTGWMQVNYNLVSPPFTQNWTWHAINSPRDLQGPQSECTASLHTVKFKAGARDFVWQGVEVMFSVKVRVL